MTLGQSLLFWLAHALMPLLIFAVLMLLVVVWFLVGGAIRAVLNRFHRKPAVSESTNASPANVLNQNEAILPPRHKSCEVKR